jgi:L-rhamnose mutarotase
MSRRHCFALDLVDDDSLIQEYRRMHGPGCVWPEVIDHIRRRGILDMQIWQRDDRLFMIIETSDDYPRPVTDAVARGANERWEQLMSTFQRRLARADSEKWAPMRRIFELSEHSGKAS